MKRWMLLGLGLLCCSGAAVAADTLYRCKAYSGGTFWSREHCQAHGALIDRIASVPSGVPFREQVRIASQGARSASEPDRPSAEQEARARREAKAQARQQARCQDLQSDIQHQESRARHGTTARQQERIRQRLQTLREHQAQAGCGAG